MKPQFAKEITDLNGSFAHMLTDDGTPEGVDKAPSPRPKGEFFQGKGGYEYYIREKDGQTIIQITKSPRGGVGKIVKPGTDAYTAILAEVGKAPSKTAPPPRLEPMEEDQPFDADRVESPDEQAGKAKMREETARKDLDAYLASEVTPSQATRDKRAEMKSRMVP